MEQGVNWKTNLAVIWASQFLSIMGFFFAVPFGPYYIQELGVRDPDAVKFWVALFGAGPPLGLAIFSPIWGVLADRYGRRLMLLRANFGAALVLFLMGLAQSVQALVFLRFAQGIVTGTITAAQAMVATSTPENRSGTALGALSAAVYSGSMSGTFVGGIFAEYFGYRAAFFAASLFLLAAGFLVLFGAREVFVRPLDTSPRRSRRSLPAWSDLRHLWPLLLLIVAMGFSRQFEFSFFPLLVQEIHGSLQGAAFWTGILSAVASAAGFFAGMIFGRLADRFAPGRVAQASAMGAALFMLPHGLAPGLLLLGGARFGMVFCAGGLEPLFQTWLSKESPAARRATVFGWATTARALGWIGAPLAGGLVATAWGIRSIYFAGIFIYLIMAGLIAWVGRKMERHHFHDHQDK